MWSPQSKLIDKTNWKSNCFSYDPVFLFKLMIIVPSSTLVSNDVKAAYKSAYNAMRSINTKIRPKNLFIHFIVLSAVKLFHPEHSPFHVASLLSDSPMSFIIFQLPFQTCIPIALLYSSPFTEQQMPVREYLASMWVISPYLGSSRFSHRR